MLTINDRDKIEWQKDITVQDLLNKMGYDYALITVTVNDEHVPKDEYDSFILKDNSEVNIFHLAHGG